MKHHAIPFSLLLSLAISGCLADMEEFEAYMLPCEEGKTICSEDGKQLLRCVNHEFVVAQFCPTQCSEGACDCEEGETICSEDRRHLLICHDHQYVYQYCPYLCSNGACNTIPEDPDPTTKCTDEETKCAGDKGNKIYRCQSGKWEHVTTCENACENGACTDKPGDDPCTKCKDGQTCDPETGICIDPPPTNCSDNEFRCAGDTLYKYDCQDGEWKLQKRCENACENGSCVSEPEIDPQTCSKQGQVMCNGSCIDPMNSKEYCGADTSCKGYHACSVDEVCQSGVCKPNACPTNQHTYQGNCEPDSVTNCGKHNYQCALEIDGWKNGTCSQGQCLATECTGSYHLFNKSCEQDSKEHCGAHNQDCRINMSGFLDGQCINHECIATSCLQGYHLYQNICEADDENHCGKHTINCYDTIQGFATGACVEGECRVATCTDGYHLDSANNQCIADTNNCCGVSCSRCTSPRVCSKGSCTAQCDAPLSKCNNECHNYANDINHCGGCNQACTKNIVSNSTNVSCSDSTCKATSCRSGYHVYNGMCEIDDVNHCGAHGAQCYAANATNIICSNGACQVTACETGYHVYNNACEADSTSNCGAHGNQCNNVANATNLCSAGICTLNCLENYGMLDDACVPAMISVWKGNKVTFPIQGKVGKIIIDWGDGKSDTFTSGTGTYITHNYSTSNQYTISVRGTINNWSCKYNNNALCANLVNIISYGNTTFGERAFYGAISLVSLPTEDTPHFNNNKMISIFERASKFNQNINFWNTSKITNMSSMFSGATAFNQPLNNWDTSNVTDMKYMFSGATAFNQPLNNWNTSNVTDMKYMFSGATSFKVVSIKVRKNWKPSISKRYLA